MINREDLPASTVRRHKMLEIIQLAISNSLALELEIINYQGEAEKVKVFPLEVNTNSVISELTVQQGGRIERYNFKDVLQVDIY